MAKSKKQVEQQVSEQGDVAVAEKPQTTQARLKSYKLASDRKPNPRTNGESGQQSNTQMAWDIVKACIEANGGVATHDQIVEALKPSGLLFKTYVPYFTNRCHWLAYAE